MLDNPFLPVGAMVPSLSVGRYTRLIVLDLLGQSMQALLREILLAMGEGRENFCASIVRQVNVLERETDSIISVSSLAFPRARHS